MDDLWVSGTWMPESVCPGPDPTNGTDTRMRSSAHPLPWCGQIVLAWALVVPALIAAPTRLAPYAPDEQTLHLWHLDEKAPPFVDSAPGGLDLQGLLNDARAGQPSLPGLGSSISFHHDAGGERGTMRLHGAILLAAPALAEGPQDNAPSDFRFAGTDGAFTYEVLARFDVAPPEAGPLPQCLISMDGESANRVFNFRIEPAGLLAFIPLATAAGGGALAAIPTTGEHAVNTTDWFHIAVTYDGREGTPNNLKLYWTRLDVPRAEAHLIGSGTLWADLPPETADFAIGNEARNQSKTLPGNAEAEPFPGCLDEVRLSAVARAPDDFVFVDPARRPQGGHAAAPLEQPPQVSLSKVWVDQQPVALPAAGHPLVLPPGPHRVDIDFGVAPQTGNRTMRLYYRLRGIDERWNESRSGMFLSCEVLDAQSVPVSTALFPASGASQGWQTSLEDSTFVRRRELLHAPPQGRALRFTFSSGVDDTTGTFAIDDLNVLRYGPDGLPLPVWVDPGFDKGNRLDRPEGTPQGWQRGGSSPMVARVGGSPKNPALALVDGDQSASGAWTGLQSLGEPDPDGQNLLLEWKEAYNVIGGTTHRAIFPKLPPGEYTFEAIAGTMGGTPGGSHLELPFRIPAPFWGRPWFWAVAAACVIGSLAMGMLAFFRQQAARRLEGLRLQNALAQDRARIARDMHDDLGTRITLLTMNATLAQDDLDKSPGHARQHLGRIAGSARDLVAAMDDLVWAVDPANDTLDHLADHLAGLAEDVFQGSPVRCRVAIPHVLPERTVTSDLRHHLSLAVKEALHNILKHAGPCEASLTLSIDGDRIEVVVADTGRGFDSSVPTAGHGRGNLPHRMEALGGTCVVESAPGHGTRVVLRCPLSPVSMEKKSP